MEAYASVWRRDGGQRIDLRYILERGTLLFLMA